MIGIVAVDPCVDVVGCLSYCAGQGCDIKWKVGNHFKSWIGDIDMHNRRNVSFSRRRQSSCIIFNRICIFMSRYPYESIFLMLLSSNSWRAVTPGRPYRPLEPWKPPEMELIPDNTLCGHFFFIFVSKLKLNFVFFNFSRISRKIRWFSMFTKSKTLHLKTNWRHVIR